MTRIETPDILNIQVGQPLNSLALKVLSGANLNKAQLENLFSSLDEFPENESLQRFATRLKEAKQRNEKIFVFGDYDADGICSTTILVRLLKKLGLVCGYYLPNRLKEGYGITPKYVQLAKEKGYTTIMTVDNGVSAFEAMEQAKKLGMEMLIVDHHIIPENGQYDYLLHPDCFSEYFTEMCGAGTALQLARYLNLADETDWILATVATIGDMVPVFFANREIIKKGLAYLNQGNYLPIKCLSKKEVFDESVIGFDIVPQLNTLGRLADRANVNTLVQYFQLEDEYMILKTASQISELNKTRQELVKDSTASAPEYIYEGENVVIYFDEKYHDGIVGLLANRYVNELNKAVLVFTKNEDVYKGSGRSPKGLDIYEHLSKYADLFAAFGGHAQACGLSICEKDFLLFVSKIIHEEKVDYVKEEESVLKVELSDLTLNNLKQLDSLRPFGQGFKQPDFYLEELVYQKTQLLKNSYRKTETQNGNEIVETLCFNTKYLDHCLEDRWVDIIVSASINSFRNRQNVSLNIRGTLSEE